MLQELHRTDGQVELETNLRKTKVMSRKIKLDNTFLEIVENYISLGYILTKVKHRKSNCQDKKKNQLDMVCFRMPISHTSKSYYINLPEKRSILFLLPRIEQKWCNRQSANRLRNSEQGGLYPAVDQSMLMMKKNKRITLYNIRSQVLIRRHHLYNQNSIYKLQLKLFRHF